MRTSIQNNFQKSNEENSKSIFVSEYFVFQIFDDFNKGENFWKCDSAGMDQFFEIRIEIIWQLGVMRLLQVK